MIIFVKKLPMIKNDITSAESVGSGHPDKLADIISDTIVDEYISKDVEARVACETLVTKGMVLLAGQVTSHSYINYDQIIRKTIASIGYNKRELGFYPDDISVQVCINEQHPELAKPVNSKTSGDFSTVYGYACNETLDYLPLSIKLAHQICERVDSLRSLGRMPYIGPDTKSLVSVNCVDNKNISLDTIAIAVHHLENISLNQLRKEIKTYIIHPLIEEFGLSLKNVQLFINPTGKHIHGGPNIDTGLTGRKLAVDNYGGYTKINSAFSGKDPSKIDRSGAYMARYIAKNIVAAGLSEKMEIQLTYSLGQANPIGININAHQTEKIPLSCIYEIINILFDLSIDGITNNFRLKRPIYAETALYGHFGHSKYPWESIDKVEEIISFLNSN